MLPAPILTILIPALVAYGAAGLLRRLRRGKAPSELAGAGIALGFLAGFCAYSGGLPFVAELPHHPVGEVAALSLAVGLALATIGLGPAKLRYVAAACGIFAALWCFGLARFEFMSTQELFGALGAALLGAVAMWRLATLASEGATPVALIALMAAGLAAIARFGRAELPEQFATALAAAAAGWLLWARPLARVPAGAAAVIGGGAILVAVAADAGRTALQFPWPMLLLPVCLWADRIAPRLPGLAKVAKRKPNRPLAFSLVAVIPVLAAAGLAFALHPLR
jgi:hypothetical protein